MSRDIFVQDLPPGVTSTDDIPDDFEPGSLPITRSEVIAAVKAEAPAADLSDPSWVVIAAEGIYHIEVNLDASEQLDSFAFHVRGGIKAERLVGRILDRLKLRAIDPDAECGLFHVG